MIRAAAAGTVLCALLVSAPAAAQSTAFSVERFTPPPGAGGFLVAEDADVLPRWAWSVSVWGSLMRRPIVLRDIIVGDRETTPVDLRLGYDLSAAVGLGSRYQLGLSLPVVAAQSGDRLRGIDLDETGLEPIAFGDLRLAAKARLAGRPGAAGFGLGASLAVTVPTGDDDHFAGEAGAVVEWRLIGSYRHRRYRVAAQLGPRFRTERVVLLSPARPHDNELVGAVAGELIVPGLALDRLSLVAEYAAVRGDAASAEGSTRGPSPREARAGARLRTAAGWVLTGAIGFGTSPAEVGSPAWRVVLGARFTTAPVSDLDRDGVEDQRDRCRSAPEDRDGYLDLDGCPDPDNDGDGVPDGADDCPDHPEDVDGVTDLDGCPES
jgi:hypothetical protein